MLPMWRGEVVSVPRGAETGLRLNPCDHSFKNVSEPWGASDSRKLEGIESQVWHE